MINFEKVTCRHASVQFFELVFSRNGDDRGSDVSVQANKLFRHFSSILKYINFTGK